MIQRLLFGVAIILVAFVQLLFATPLWTSVLLTATLCILGTGITNAIVRTHEIRAFWIGFSVFGIGYLSLASQFSQGSAQSILGLLPGSSPQPKLLTTRLLNGTYSLLAPTATDIPGFLDDSESHPLLPTLGVSPIAGSVARNDDNTPTSTDPPSGALAQYLQTRILYKLPDYHNYMLIGHCLWCLLLARIGGAIGRYLYMS